MGQDNERLLFRVSRTDRKNINEVNSSKYKSYTECLIKGVDPLDGEYIELKIVEKHKEVAKTMKAELKEEILIELWSEMNENFEELKREYDQKYDFNLLNDDDDHMDIAGHGQRPE